MAYEQILECSCSDNAHDIQLDRLLRDKLGNISWNRARQLIATGKVSVNGCTVLDPSTRVHPGDQVHLNPTAPKVGTRHSPPIPVLYVDSQIVVVNKPPGISTVPYDKEERGTLYQQVRSQLSTRNRRTPAPLHVVHRIDKETSGVVVFARTHSALLRLKQLFRRHDIERRYMALVHGKLEQRIFRSRLIADRGDGKRGSTLNAKLGREAVTHARPVEFFRSATLVECTLETGRTHQIRIQLSEAGFPLFGECVYAKAVASAHEVPRLMLHAKMLGFIHPNTEIPMHFTLDMPDDMRTFLEGLRVP